MSGNRQDESSLDSQQDMDFILQRHVHEGYRLKELQDGDDHPLNPVWRMVMPEDLPLLAHTFSSHKEQFNLPLLSIISH